MIADAVDHHGADAVGQIGEAIQQRQNDAVVQRIALGRPVEADAEHRARRLDGEQRGPFGGRGGGVSHGRNYVLSRIVMFYNDFGRSQCGIFLTLPWRAETSKARSGSTRV